MQTRTSLIRQSIFDALKHTQHICSNCYHVHLHSLKTSKYWCITFKNVQVYCVCVLSILLRLKSWLYDSITNIFTQFSFPWSWSCRSITDAFTAYSLIDFQWHQPVWENERHDIAVDHAGHDSALMVAAKKMIRACGFNPTEVVAICVAFLICNLNVCTLQLRTCQIERTRNRTPRSHLDHENIRITTASVEINWFQRNNHLVNETTVCRVKKVF